MKTKKIVASLAAFALSALVFAGGRRDLPQITINSAADLQGLRLGCQAGTTGEIYIQEQVADAQLRSFRTGMDAALDLKNGNIDAIIIDELPANEIVKRNPDLKVLDLRFTEPEEYAIAVRKGNTALLNSINNTIARMRSDGTYERLVEAFMPADGNIQVPAKIAMSGPALRMGTNAAFPPFEYVEGAEPIGFDVTMSQMIARDYGRTLEVVDMAFDGLIAALQSGAVDFVAAGMTATDERRQNVDFSEPYYSTNQVIIVRAN